ncbi:MAG TPA: ABC transporter substrate-binding protein [Candidatus Limnocylindrales bacterium]|nr:ABC transporter substrate-binding protein [Candidatus Limnocylindrales bacterium]
MAQSARVRFGRALLASALLGATLLPAGVPALASNHEPLVLRAGTDQDLQVLNPWNSVVVADFEVYTLNYDLLVNFGQDLEPVPGFAESWDQDGTTWTFHIRPGMNWSDGEPATADDVAYTFQLILDAVDTDYGCLGQCYLDGYLLNAGVTSVEATDAETVVIETEFENTLLLQSYVPILPEHVWSEYTLEEIGNHEGVEPFLNDDLPVVGTGPYQAVEFEPGNFIRFARNEHDWRDEQGAPDEVIIQHFSSIDTAVQALRTGEIDYVRGILADQFDALRNEPDIAVVEGIANGYTELSFNTGGNSEGYGGRTAALSDPAFRDALGYAIDTDALVEATLGGYGTPGSTIIPPFHTRWHVPPENPRTFDLAEADRRLTAAGYVLDGDGRRLDKDGNQLNLRLTWPDSEAENATNAQFMVEWFGDLGIEIDAAVTEEGALIDAVTGPPNGPADYDLYMWGWVGDPDPTSLLNFFRTEEIGFSSDSFYSNERYDELFLLQRAESDEEQRLAYLTEMQELVYAEAPYHILYYDAELHAYRTDRFGGWTLQPSEGGTPLFGYGSFGYTKLTSLAEPTPEPSSAAPSGAASPPPSGGGETPASTDSTLLILGVVALVAVIAVGLVLVRRRPSTEEE